MDRPAPNPESAHPTSREPPGVPPAAERDHHPPTGPYHGSGPDTPFSQQHTAAEGDVLHYRPASGTVGNYELLAEVARGGMGIVYQARHATGGQVVALKMMRTDAEPQHAERFDREVRAATWLKHPNIVPVYEVSRHRGESYYTMEFVSGGSLAQQRTRLLAEPQTTLALMAKVAEAVQYAHEQGIIHRDLKLSNVLLAADGTPKVTDFGLAKLSDGDLNLTQSGAALGTVPYMAPEQAAGRTKQIGPATDIWALGVMLYELLTGRRPFDGADSDAVKRLIRKSEPPRPRSLRPALSEAVERVVLRCLEKEPRRRYQTAGALAHDLERCARGEEIPPQPERGFRRLGRAVGRHPLKCAALVLCVIAIAVAAAAVLDRGPRRSDTPVQPEQPPDPGITLIGDSGPPQQFRWVLGEKCARLGEEKAGEPFSCRSSGISLLELRETPPWASYRVEAMVRQDDNKEGEAGIYFAHRRFRSGQRAHQCCGLVSVNQIDTSPGTVFWEFKCFTESEPPDTLAGSVLKAFNLPAELPGQDPARWHRLAVEVEPQEVRVYWRTTCISRVAVPVMQQSLAGLAHDVPGCEYTSQGGLGLYVRKTTASFYQVTVKPLR
jgi:serine/threonine-protein kinase